MAAFLMGVSHYIISFGRIGYGIMPALFAEMLVLTTAAWAIRSKRLLAYAAMGLAMGFAFYVYPAALYTLPLPLLLLLIYATPTNRKVLVVGVDVKRMDYGYLPAVFATDLLANQNYLVRF